MLIDTEWPLFRVISLGADLLHQGDVLVSNFNAAGNRDNDRFDHADWNAMTFSKARLGSVLPRDWATPMPWLLGRRAWRNDEWAGELFVASTGDNAIYAVSQGGSRWRPEVKGRLVYRDNNHLRGPVGLLLEPDCNLVATNGDAINGDPTQPSGMVEFTRTGKFLTQ